MEVIYSDAAKQRPDHYALLQKATAQLQEVMGRYSTGVKAEWDRKQDELGTVSYSLRISDKTGAVSASFRPAELATPLHMGFYLPRLWGELVDLRLDKIMRKLQQDEA